MRRLCNIIAFIIFWVVVGFIAFGATGEVSTGMSVYLGAVAFVCFWLGVLCACQAVTNKDLI